jgi:acyl carrier protein/NAD(P)-dependent dehydrogenase (short-subunit alcohol dehydrogenase family)
VENIVLMGRHEPGDAAKKKIGAIERNGARVLCVRGDVARETDVQAVLAEAGRAMPPMSSVFHCAGVLDDGILVELDAPRFASVLAPKIQGAMNLDHQTRALPIRKFVLFSSWASMFGSPGQANHAAANAYMDALVQGRRAEGLPGQSINWGPWSEIGAAARYADRMTSRGVGCFTPREGLLALTRLLESNRVQSAVAPFDMNKWLAAFPSAKRTGLFDLLSADLSETESPAGATPAGKSVTDICDKLSVTPGQRQRAHLMETWLCEQASVVLRLPSARVELAQPLKSLGFDSLMAVEFRNRLESSLGMKLPATLIWNYPTIGHIAKHLLERLDASMKTETASTGTAETKSATGLDAASVMELSEAETERQIEERLRDLERNF